MSVTFNLNDYKTNSSAENNINIEAEGEKYFVELTGDSMLGDLIVPNLHLYHDGKIIFGDNSEQTTAYVPQPEPTPLTQLHNIFRENNEFNKVIKFNDINQSGNYGQIYQMGNNLILNSINGVIRLKTQNSLNDIQIDGNNNISNVSQISLNTIRLIDGVNSLNQSSIIQSGQNVFIPHLKTNSLILNDISINEFVSSQETTNTYLLNQLVTTRNELGTSITNNTTSINAIRTDIRDLSNNIALNTATLQTYQNTNQSILDLQTAVSTANSNILTLQNNTSNISNTSDLNKPISTATQTALNLKAPISNPTFTGTANIQNLIIGGSTNVNNTLSYITSQMQINEGIYTNGIASLETLKAPIDNPSFTTKISTPNLTTNLIQATATNSSLSIGENILTGEIKFNSPSGTNRFYGSNSFYGTCGFSGNVWAKNVYLERLGVNSSAGILYVDASNILIGSGNVTNTIKIGRLNNETTIDQNGNWNFGNKKLTNTRAATDTSDLVNKGALDSSISTLKTQANQFTGINTFSNTIKTNKIEINNQNEELNISNNFIALPSGAASVTSNTTVALASPLVAINGIKIKQNGVIDFRGDGVKNTIVYPYGSGAILYNYWVASSSTEDSTQGIQVYKSCSSTFDLFNQGGTHNTDIRWYGKGIDPTNLTLSTANSVGYYFKFSLQDRIDRVVVFPNFGIIGYNNLNYTGTIVVNYYNDTQTGVCILTSPKEVMKSFKLFLIVDGVVELL